MQLHVCTVPASNAWLWNCSIILQDWTEGKGHIRSLVAPLLPHILPLKLFLNFMSSDTRSHASQAGLRLRWGMFSFSKLKLSWAAHAPRNYEWRDTCSPAVLATQSQQLLLEGLVLKPDTLPRRCILGSTVSLITEGFQSREPIWLRSSISTSQPLVTLSAWEFLAMWPSFWLIRLLVPVLPKQTSLDFTLPGLCPPLPWLSPRPQMSEVPFVFSSVDSASSSPRRWGSFYSALGPES